MKNAIIVSLVIIFLFGCKEKTSQTGPLLSGDITGIVHLSADNGLPLTDESGTQVSLESSSFSTLTLSDGSWTLEGVPLGTYTIVFSKKGFSTGTYFDFHLVNQGIHYISDRYLGQLPQVKVMQLALVSADSTNSINIRGKLSFADSLMRPVEIIFDKSPIIISSSMPYLSDLKIALQPDSTYFSATLLDVNTISGISTGSKLYARAFALPRNGYYGTYNPTISKYEIYNSGFFFSNLDSVIVH